MRRYICCFLILGFLIAMTACGKDPDVIGIWEQEIEISILGCEEPASAISVLRFTFQEDGSGVQEQIFKDHRYPDAAREFRYRQERNTLILDYSENCKEEFKVVRDGRSLRLENNRGSFKLKKVN